MSRSLHYSSAHVLHVPNSMRADDYCREVESGIMQLNTRRLNGRVNPLIHLSALFKGHPSPPLTAGIASSSMCLWACHGAHNLLPYVAILDL